MSVKDMISWFRVHKFEAHLLSFIMMTFASVGMYLTLNPNANGLRWFLIGAFLAANVLAIVVK
jgi:hypothetical protein